ncbi:MAG: hypothetical protein WAK58_23095 [Trebonia sp.]
MIGAASVRDRYGLNGACPGIRLSNFQAASPAAPDELPGVPGCAWQVHDALAAGQPPRQRHADAEVAFADLEREEPGDGLAVHEHAHARVRPVAPDGDREFR